MAGSAEWVEGVCSEDGNLHVFFGPQMEEASRKPWKDRYCFVCRKRRSFDWIVMAPVIPENPTIDDMPWYGPYAKIECGQCGTQDGDMFPGYEREWVDDWD